MTWSNVWWSHCHQKYPWTRVIFLLTFYSHYPFPGARVCAAPGMLQVSFGGFLSTTLIHVNSFLPFLFPVPLERVSENLSFHRFGSLRFCLQGWSWAHSRKKRRRFSLTLAQTSLRFSSKHIQYCLKTLKELWVLVYIKLPCCKGLDNGVCGPTPSAGPCFV